MPPHELDVIILAARLEMSQDAFAHVPRQRVKPQQPAFVGFNIPTAKVVHLTSVLMVEGRGSGEWVDGGVEDQGFRV